MPKRSDYYVVQETDRIIFIVDEDRGGMSVTNDAENVVRELLAKFGPSRRIVYRDSQKCWDELVHNGKEFTRFGRFFGETPVVDE